MAEPLARRVEALFFAASRLDPVARAEFLAARAEEDPEAAAEARAMLDLSDKELEQVFAEPAYGAASGESAGDHLGPYKLLEELGEGGFGTVWRAEQVRPVRRTVALKILKLGMDTKQVLARFEVERNALSLMNHPSIARVIDAGATETGRPFFVMELVEGIRITDFCDQEELSLASRLALFIDVCAAVQHAHQKGVIHRDLKPANILVTMLDGKPLPKVIDFGIAKATGQSLSEGTLFTLQGQLMGTPEYMSPEQAEMSGIGVDSTTDIYALGVVLYELLTGVLPFDPETLRSRGLAEIHRFLREEEPPKPSTRISTLGAETTAIGKCRRIDPRKLKTELSGDLDWIVLRAMEKQRTRRYPSASELAADVRRHLIDEPVLAGPPSAVYRTRKFVRRHRASVVFAATVLVLLIGGVATTTRGMFLAERAREGALAAEKVAESQRAEAERQKLEALAQREEAQTQAVRAEESLALASNEAARARAVTDFLLDTLGLADPDVAELSSMSMAAALDEAATRVGEAFRDYPENEAEVRLVLGRAYFTLGRPDLAQPQLRRALFLHRSVLKSDARPIRDIVSVLWWVDYRLWDDDWLMLGVESRELSFELLGRKHPDLAEGFRETLQMAYDPSVLEAQLIAKWEDLCRTGRERIRSDEPEFGDLARVASSVPFRLSFQSDTTAAAEMLEKLIPWRGNGVGRQYERLLTEFAIHFRLQAGDAAGTRTLLDSHAAPLAKLLAPDHWYQEIYWSYEARCLVLEGRGEEALLILERCLASLKASPAPSLPEGMVVRQLLAQIHEQAGRSELAAMHWRGLVARMFDNKVPIAWPATKQALPLAYAELVEAVDALDAAIALCSREEPSPGACAAQLEELAGELLDTRRRRAPDGDPSAPLFAPYFAGLGASLLLSPALARVGEALLAEAHHLGKQMGGAWLSNRIWAAAKLHSHLVLAGRTSEGSALALDLGDLMVEAAAFDRGWLWLDAAERIEMIWDLVRVPGLASATSNVVANLALELLGTEESTPESANTLGVALYRAGRHGEAVRVLERAAALSTALGEVRGPANLAFLAMSQHRLGRSAQAEQSLVQLKAWAQEAGRDATPESRAFLAEAERLLVGE